MGDTFILWVVITIIGVFIALVVNVKTDPKKAKKMQQEINQRRIEFERQKKIETYGYISPAMICPHCQTKGQISTKPVKRKKGVSGAKVTGALLTFGVSMLATGLSRKEGLTQAHCGNCGSTWDF